MFINLTEFLFILLTPCSVLCLTIIFLSCLGQFYAIGFEGNVDPPSTDGEIQRVKVQHCYSTSRKLRFFLMFLGATVNEENSVNEKKSRYNLW